MSLNDSRFITDTGEAVKQCEVVTDPDTGFTVSGFLTERTILKITKLHSIYEMDLCDLIWLDEATLIEITRSCGNTLKVLLLDRCNVSDEVLKQIAFSAPHIRKLSISGCDRTSISGISVVLSVCTSLTNLNLAGNSNLLNYACKSDDDFLLDIYEKTVPSILRTDLPIHLTDRNQRDTFCSRKLFAELIEKLPGLTSLSLANIENVDDQLLSKFSSNMSLKVLDLSGTCIGDLGLSNILKLVPTLVNLSIAFCFNIESLEPLCTLLHLEHLRAIGLYKLESNEIIELISKIGHNLKSLDLSGCSNLSSACIRSISDRCFRLVSLNMTGCIHLESESFENMWMCSKLKTLCVNSCYQLDLEYIRRKLDQVEVVRIRSQSSGTIVSSGIVPNWKPLPLNQQLKSIATNAAKNGSSKKKKDTKK